MTCPHPTPRSILLPSPTRTHHQDVSHPYPPGFPQQRPPASPSAPSEGDAHARRRTSITIDDRPRIVVRPVPLVDDRSRRDRRRSSGASSPSSITPFLRSRDAGRTDDAPDGQTVARKASTSAKVFSNFFSGGRKKKLSKDDITMPPGLGLGNTPLAREGSVESLEGEIVANTQSTGQTITIKSIRKRATSSSPAPAPSNNTNNPTIGTLQPASLPATRRASESDIRNQPACPGVRPPALTLTINTQTQHRPAPSRSLSSPDPTNSPSAYRTHQQRRRSSTRLVSPSLSLSLSGPGQGPGSPGFSSFQGFGATAASGGYPSPRSPLSGSPFGETGVPFSLTIRQEAEAAAADGEAEYMQRHRESTAADSSGMFDVRGWEMGPRFDPDPAQFEDLCDGDWVGGENPVGLCTPPMTAVATTTGFPAPSHAGRTESVAPMGDGPVAVVHTAGSAQMHRSGSGPWPTFKVIPATPIVPGEAEADEGTPGGPYGEVDAERGKRDRERGKKRGSMPPVPVNPIRPRKLELSLDLDLGFGVSGKDGAFAGMVDGGSADGGARSGFGVFQAFHSSDGSDEDSTTHMDHFTSPTCSSPRDAAPARSPSAESLQRNTAPLRLSHSPRLVTAVNVCHPVNSSLSMASSCQSSRALTLSASSTVGSSFDSLDALDLDDVESALGTMLASLSTRPSFANRLTLDDPLLGERRDMKPASPAAPGIELSALGFGEPHQAHRHADCNLGAATENYYHNHNAAQTGSFDIYGGQHARHDSYGSEADGEVNDSETDSIFSDIDDLGSVSIAVVQKTTGGVFASPRTLSIGDSGVERLRH